MDFEGRTPLHNAIIYNLVEDEIVNLVENGASVNAVDFEGTTPLILAAEKGLTSVASLLIEKGACVNWQNKHGNSALHSAIIEKRNRDLIALLINKGAKASLVDNMRHTPVEHALKWFFCKSPEAEAIVPLLSAAAGKILQCEDFVDQFGNTSVHRVIIGRNFDWKEEELDELLRSRADDLIVKNVFGHTPLHVNGSKFMLDVCRSHLNDSAFRCTDNRGRNFWHFIFSSFNVTPTSIMKLFGFPDYNSICVSVDESDDFGRTPLHYKAMKEENDWLQEEDDDDKILEVGWTHKPDAYGRTPDIYAAIFQQEKMFEIANRLSSTKGNEDRHHHSAAYYNEMARQFAKREEERNKNDASCQRHISDLTSKVRTLPRNCISLRRSDEDEKEFVLKYWREINLDNGVSCPLSKEIFDRLRETVRHTMENLLKRISLRDNRFRGDLHLAGSVFEGTRVDNCDFDFLVLLPFFGDICECSESESAPGYVRLARKFDDAGQNSSAAAEEFFTSDNYLDTHLVKFTFEMLVKTVLSCSDFQRENDCLEFVDLEKTNDVYYNYSSDKPSLTLKMRAMSPIGDTFIFHPIEIDIVPAVQAKGWRPKNLVNNSLIAEAHESDGCHVVFDQPHRKYPCLGWSHTHARIDFALVESRIILKCPLVVRSAYKVVKKMVKSYCGKMFKSYVLKGAVLSCLDRGNSRPKRRRCAASETESYEVDESELLVWVRRILRRLIDIVVNDCVPSYVMPSFLLPACEFEKFVKFSHILMHLSGLSYGDLVDKRKFKIATENKNQGPHIERISKAYLYTHILYWSTLPHDKRKLFSAPIPNKLHLPGLEINKQHTARTARNEKGIARRVFSLI